jgi:hypothetical protein
MERLPHSKYTRESRLKAVRLVTENGLSAQEASMRLSLPKSTLSELAASLQSLQAETDRVQPASSDEDGGRTGPGQAGACSGADGARHPKKSGRVLCQGVAARHAVVRHR